MKKLLLQIDDDLFKWMDSMGFADGQITYVPKSYPCFIVWCEVDGEAHEFVYPSDFPYCDIRNLGKDFVSFQIENK